MATAADPPLVEESAEAPAAIEGMDAVHAALARFWEEVAPRSLPGMPDDPWRALFDSAVAEIAANIVRHAYPPGETGGRFRLALRCYGDRVEADLTDNGVRFEPPQTVAGPDLLDCLHSSPLDGGWGLLMAWAAVDRIGYQRSTDGRNLWHIEKRMDRKPDGE